MRGLITLSLYIHTHIETWKFTFQIWNSTIKYSLCQQNKRQMFVILAQSQIRKDLRSVSANQKRPPICASQWGRRQVSGAVQWEAITNLNASAVEQVFPVPWFLHICLVSGLFLQFYNQSSSLQPSASLHGHSCLNLSYKYSFMFTCIFYTWSSCL